MKKNFKHDIGIIGINLTFNLLGTGSIKYSDATPMRSLKGLP